MVYLEPGIASDAGNAGRRCSGASLQSIACISLSTKDILRSASDLRKRLVLSRRSGGSNKGCQCDKSQRAALWSDRLMKKSGCIASH
jgi:hypothetical protein